MLGDGETLGEIEGLLDGLTDTEGETLGLTEGLILTLGDCDGEMEGEILGEIDTEGDTDGERDGDIDGLGLTDGERLGDIEGEMLGLGETDGEMLGDTEAEGDPPCGGCIAPKLIAQLSRVPIPDQERVVEVSPRIIPNSEPTKLPKAPALVKCGAWSIWLVIAVAV